MNALIPFEATIALVVAVFTGLGVVHNRLTDRMNRSEHKIAEIALRISDDYLKKSEFQIFLEKLESHLFRVEEKLDGLRDEEYRLLMTAMARHKLRQEGFDDEFERN